jgi:Glycosyltransferase like family 2
VQDSLLFLMLATSLLIALSSFDDLLIDFLATGIRRFSVTGREGESIEIPTTAIFVANWKEEDVLGKMVEGNLARIEDSQVIIFLGVYPNDEGTLRVACHLQEQHPSRVRVIVNRLAGPTSKGQMLNEMFRQVYAEDNVCPELVVLHDSEDVIDRRTFGIYAAYAASGHDFVQLPVFSLDRGKRAFVAATYMDEFAERHTREMIVRSALGAMIPSAGVGTCLTKKLIKYFLATRGQVLKSGTVTEDYILGVEAKRAGFKSAFAALSADELRGYDFIATREFFPRTLKASIKQKARWVYGINFEAMHKLGWGGDLVDKYFFLRDRKGMLANFLPPISLFFMALVALGYVDLRDVPSELETLFAVSIDFNIFALIMRYFVRVSACYQVYGTRNWWNIAARWPVALYINMAAAFRAWKTYVGESRFATRPIVWSKTAHELPTDFIAAKR